MRRTLLIAIALFAVGCQPAHRAAVVIEKKEARPPAKSDAHRASVSDWLVPTETPDGDIPLVFVARAPGRTQAWDALPGFWNRFPMPGAGAATVHIGLDPMGAVLAIGAAQEMEAIHVKVPRHLGPVPIDPINPPTLGRWLLGKKIFFDRVLAVGDVTYSCADCHHPDRGFANGEPNSSVETRRRISLIDVAVRTPLFWDGRAEKLEEVLAPSTAGPPGGLTHRFDKVAGRLDGEKWYRLEFERLMGIKRVTEDAVAKVLATYLRTILSGDSLIDRADVRAGTPPGTLHTATEFEALLGEVEASRLKRFAGFAEINVRELARNLEVGQRIAHGSGRCYRCHAAPGEFGRPAGFHNILVGDSDNSQLVTGAETGRFAVLPIGLKDFAMRGAYRAPPLKNLAVRAPYFHNGSRRTLRDVIDHYNVELEPDHPLLDPILRDLVGAAKLHDARGRPVLWNEEEVDALVTYLAACEGDPVDPIVCRPQILEKK